MRCWRERKAGARRGALILAAAALGACEQPPRSYCPALTQLADAPVRWAQIVSVDGQRLLVTKGYRGVQCHPVREEGRLGPATCRTLTFEDGTGFGDPVTREAVRAAIPWGAGLRLVTEKHSIYVEPDSLLARKSAIAPPADVPSDRFSLGLVLPGEGALHVAWSARGPGTGEWVAGLGALDERDRVRALGEPFFRGAVDRDVLRVEGARDPDTGHFWIDSPDGIHVLELDVDGSLLRSAEIGEPVGRENDMPYLDEWTKLPDGTWLGLAGGWLCRFQPLDRTGQRCVRFGWGEGIPRGYAITYDLFADPDGVVWTASHLSPDETVGDAAVGSEATGVVVGWWDQVETIHGTYTPHRPEECDFLLGAN